MTLRPRGLAAFAAFLFVAGVVAGLPVTAASAAPDPNWAKIKINEVSSDNNPAPVRDTVELTNTGDTAVSIAGWLQGDSGGPSVATDFSGRVHLLDGTLTTSIPAHG